MSTTITRYEIRPAKVSIRALWMLIGAEARMVLRDTAGLLVPLALPILMLVAGASAFGDVMIGDRTVLEVVILPTIVTTVFALIGVTNLPGFLASYRKSGVLRTLAVTPLSPGFVLIAQGVVSAVQAALGVAIALAVAHFGFGASMPADIGTALWVAALALTSMCAVGLLIAAVAPTPNSAVAMGLITFLVFGATGGMFGGTGNLPETVRTVGEALPFGAASQAMSFAAMGVPQEPGPLIAMGVAIVVCGAVAAALFRWE